MHETLRQLGEQAPELPEDLWRFRVMADTAPVLLWIADTDGLCKFFNQPWLAFTGRTMEMEIGNGWAEGVHPEDFQTCMDTYMNAFVAREPFRMEYRLRRADGEYRWVLDTGVPMRAPEGTFSGYIGSCVDVTEFRAARDELDRKVRERTAELEAFCYSVSHDLRAPIRHVDGFAHALDEDCGEMLDANGRGHIAGIRQAAARMAELIDDLLQLSRLGLVELRTEPVDLSALALSVIAELRAAEPARQVHVSVAPGLQAQGDPHTLRIAFHNLLANAWKFTSKTPDARIDVGGLLKNGQDVCFIRDNGAGFNMDFAARLFGPFQRLHTEHDFPGIGIGLAIVRRVAHRHGGRVWAEGAVGKGATFFVALPPAKPDG
jgi:PAS domain S-box-containing protein